MDTQLKQIIENQFNDFKVMFEVLWDDVIKTGQMASDSSDVIGFERRSAVRACFAFIEGLMTRAESLSTLIRVIRGDSPKKRALDAMMNNIIRQSPQNRIDKYKDKRNFMQRMKESLKAISLVANEKLDLSDQNKNIEDFKKAIKVRDRLMHPKVASDLRVSDAEFVLVLNSTRWYRERFEGLLENTVKRQNAA